MTVDFLLYIRLKKIGVAPFIAFVLANPKNLIRLERHAFPGSSAQYLIRVLLNFPLLQRRDFVDSALPLWCRKF